jgi:nicotinamide phosphoribosyltransferase
MPKDLSKASKKGRLALTKEGNAFNTVRQELAKGNDILETVFENGEIVKEITFDTVRKNAAL